MGERKLFLDIETTEIVNGSELPNKIFCLVTICDKGNLVCYSPNDLHKFQNDAKNYQEFIGHNIIGFDLPALGKLLGFEWWGEVEDTLVMSRLDNPSREGGHSLASWGTRLNFPKGEYDDWSMYTEEMGEYCKQDVKVLVKLYKLMTGKGMSK